MEKSIAVLKNAFSLVTLIILPLVCINTTIGQTIHGEGFPKSETEIPELDKNELSMFVQKGIQSGIEQGPFYLFPVTESYYRSISMPDDSFGQSTWRAYYRNETFPNARIDLGIVYDPEDSLSVRFVSEDARRLCYELLQKNRNSIRIPNHVRYNIALRSLGRPHKEKKRSILIANPATKSIWKGVDSVLRMFVTKSSKFKHRPK